MKKLKSYKLFLEDKKVDISDSQKQSIMQFLNAQEKIMNLYFLKIQYRIQIR